MREPPPLRAVHVVAGLEEAYGGLSYSVPTLCARLAGSGADVELLSTRDPNIEAHSGETDRYFDRRFRRDFRWAPILRKLRYSAGLGRALYDAASRADVVHDHGIWLMPNVQAGWAAAAARRPLVISPRGMLAPAALAFSSLKKRAFWTLLQGRVVRGAACLHATSEQEYEEIREFGLGNPVAIIPNGIDLPNPAVVSTWRPTTDRTVLSLGRIHPKKGLDRLIAAWAALEAAHPGWRLRIIGPAERGHDEELRRLAASLGVVRAAIEGPAYGDAKLAAYRNADLFVLPTLNENFGLTVAEALATGIPAISTKGAPWEGLGTEGCGWWIDHGVESLAFALKQAMAMPKAVLSSMGSKGREWMARDFSWGRVACDMLAVYRWLAEQSESPPTVRLS